MKNSPATIFGTGQQTKDFHYIDDLITAYVLILEKWNELDLFGQSINFGTGKETSIKELAEVIIKTVSEKTGRKVEDIKKPIYLSQRPGEVMRFVADTSFADEKLGFKPKINLKEGISKYIDWFLANHSHSST